MTVAATTSGPELLSNLSNVKAWLNIAGTQSDTLLSGLLQRTSSKILGYLERDSLIMRTYTDTVDGQGNRNQFLENWPIIAVNSVYIGNQLIAAATPAGPTDTGNLLGYRFEDWDGIPPGSPAQVELLGYIFPRGHLNIAINYDAGYGIQGEAHTIAAALTVNQIYGTWSVDYGVIKVSTGLPMTYVVSQSPAAGQYSISTDPSSTAGTYLFNSADVGTAVKISYSYIPSTLEQACLDMVNDVFQRRSRPGVKSHNLATMESGTFESNYGIPPWAVADLQPYKSILPL
jgi:hypothetical protein